MLLRGHLITGKKMLHEVLFGGSGPQSLAKHAFTGRMRTLARWLRWLACTLLPDIIVQREGFSSAIIFVSTSAGQCEVSE